MFSSPDCSDAQVKDAHQAEANHGSVRRTTLQFISMPSEKWNVRTAHTLEIYARGVGIAAKAITKDRPFKRIWKGLPSQCPKPFN
ncbi:hypothetical protein DPMN_103289 [Dreissena polymorpha]|uniref:Uncharacterized protein n=1 Tax=Dreissena polymorpha TaxID=45954 RepID=A0A9D4H869_DREPO|nr:hypothetical protein DPMN_103289 [Dreissena polymorpha]